MLRVLNAEYLDGYSLRLSFSDGSIGVADLEEALGNDPRPIFAQLRELQRFREFKLERGTVVWSNGLDLAPEYLFFLAFNSDARLQDQFKSWGYMTEATCTA